MQDPSDISNMIQLLRQRDLASPETFNAIKYLIMSTWLADITQEPWDIHYFLSDRGQNHTVSFVDYFYYFLLIIM